jgi:hypothetical protein
MFGCNIMFSFIVLCSSLASSLRDRRSVVETGGWAGGGGGGAQEAI